MAKMKILLIDDEQDFLDVVSARVKKWGHDAIMASSGKDGLDIIMSKNPDMVILDYIMPGMDGIETLKEIRKISRQIPVIMFTGHPDVNSIEGAKALSVTCYIPKISPYLDVQGNLRSAIDMIAKKLKK